MLSASIAQAGGIDRTGQVITPLFETGGETGSYAELSFGSVYPSVSGSALGIGSGDMAGQYLRFGAAYKTDINDRVSLAVIFDQPYGADVDYPTGTGYPFAGSTASFDSNAITGILRYKFDNGISLHAGLRAQEVSAEVSIPSLAGYRGSSPSDVGFGYLLGAAYERPEIGLRVALTYFSKVEHDTEANEFTAVTGNTSNPTSFETPQAVNLDLQTGINENTLLFGSARWVNWGDFTLNPPVYESIVGLPILYYNGDYTTYTIGVGRKFNENWSGTIALSYEPSNGGYTTNLGPHDGLFGVLVGVKYTQDRISISGGVNMSWIGDAETVVSRDPFATSSFTDNTAIGAGIRIGYNF
ncbi:MAG: hypothetical protein CMF73_13175 [Maricaulis sp.]|nr:hypothetical protein [Maricaulis sp.]